MWTPEEASKVKYFILKMKHLTVNPLRPTPTFVLQNNCTEHIKLDVCGFLEEIIKHESVRFPRAALAWGWDYKEQKRNWGECCVYFSCLSAPLSFSLSALQLTPWTHRWDLSPTFSPVTAQDPDRQCCCAVCFNAGSCSGHRFTTHITTISRK